MLEKHVVMGLWFTLLGCAEAHERPPRDAGQADSSSNEGDPPSTDESIDRAEPGPAAISDDAGSSQADGPAESARDASTTPDLGTLDAAAPLATIPSLSVFDPKQVYIFGSLRDGVCDVTLTAAPVLEPSSAAFGFTCASYQLLVRPSDGRLLYSIDIDTNVRVFSCEDCSAAEVAKEFWPHVRHDPITSPCGGEAGRFPYFDLLPDGGLVQQCGTEWRTESGSALAPASGIMAFGHAYTALRLDAIVSLTDMQVRPIVGLPARYGGAHRVSEDGYWLLMSDEAADAPAELWHVDFQGVARRLGRYPALPEGSSGWSPQLDAEGRLYQVTHDLKRDVVTRRSIEGESAIVYDSSANPRVRLRYIELFTGP